MRKIVVHRPGGHEQLGIEEHPEPAPGRGEVLVATEAIGVNYADCMVRMGLYESAKKFVGWPITPGFELAGTVVAAGEGVDAWQPGQKVFAVTRFGAYATHVVVPAHQVFALPAELSMAEAAALPAVFLTAHYALFELAHPRAGQRVLVHSAAGGVGGALLQLARIAGCRTVGVVGAAHKREAALAQGAGAVIDKSSEDLWGRARQLAPEGYDVVLDANGASTLAESYRHLRSPGKLVIYGFHSMLPRGRGRPSYLKLALDYLRTPRFDPLKLTGDNKSVLAFNLSYLFEERDILVEGMTRILGWIHDGRVRPPPITEFPFEKVAAAHGALESGTTVGKLVLTRPRGPGAPSSGTRREAAGG